MTENFSFLEKCSLIYPGNDVIGKKPVILQFLVKLLSMIMVIKCTKTIRWNVN